MKKCFLILFSSFILFPAFNMRLFSAENQSGEVNSPQTNDFIFQIDTDPGRAEVYIDGVFVGLTPLNRLRAQKGNYAVRIYKKNYEIYNTTIKLTEEGQKYTFNLIKKPWLPQNNNFSIKGSIPFFSEVEQDFKFSLFFAYRYMFPHTHPLKNFDIEFSAGIMSMDILYRLNGIDNAGKTKLTILPVAINFHYNFFRNFPWVSPYIGLGFGATIFNVALDDYEKTSLTFALIAGINFFTQSPISFQIEVKYVWLGTASIVETASGDPITVNSRKLVSFKGFLFNVALVGRF